MWRPPEPRVFESRAARRQAGLSIAIVVTAVLAGTAAIPAVIPWITDPTAIRSRFAAFGVWAPIAFVTAQTAQVILAPLPGQLFGVAGGYLFGPLRGTAYSMLGVTIGSYAVIAAARALGRPAVERWVADDVRGAFEERVREGGVPTLFVLYLLPAFPDDAICVLAGLTSIRMRILLALVVVGRTPSFLFVAYAGSRVAERALLEATLVFAALTVVSIAGYRWRGRLEGLA